QQSRGQAVDPQLQVEEHGAQFRRRLPVLTPLDFQGIIRFSRFSFFFFGRTLDKGVSGVVYLSRLPLRALSQERSPFYPERQLPCTAARIAKTAISLPTSVFGLLPILSHPSFQLSCVFLVFFFSHRRPRRLCRDERKSGTR
ncbi:MAG: hypothetical protein K2H77_03385, partial [Alistipes sp.]|nr:hypothetical protein [Alistipes sp.]